MSKEFRHLDIFIHHCQFKESLNFLLIALAILPLPIIALPDKGVSITVTLVEILLGLSALYLFLTFTTILSLYDQKKGYISKAVTKKIKFTLKNISRGQGHGVNFYNVPHHSNYYYDPYTKEDEISFDRYQYVFKKDNGKSVWTRGFYTDGKADEIKRFAKMMNHQGNIHPLQFTYYTHGHILISVDLVEGYEYPENFEQWFSKIKERI